MKIVSKSWNTTLYLVFVVDKTNWMYPNIFYILARVHLAPNVYNKSIISYNLALYITVIANINFVNLLKQNLNMTIKLIVNYKR